VARLFNPCSPCCDSPINCPGGNAACMFSEYSESPLDHPIYIEVPTLYTDNQCDVTNLIDGDFVAERLDGWGIMQRVVDQSYIADPHDCDCPDLEEGAPEQWAAQIVITPYCQNNLCRIQVTAYLQRRLIFVGASHSLGWGPAHWWTWRSEPLTSKPKVNDTLDIPFESYLWYTDSATVEGSDDWILCPGTEIQEPGPITITFD